MKYRDHRGGLAESLETTIEVSSRQELFNYLVESNPYYDIEEINFEYSCYDSRIDWDTYYVSVRERGKDDFFIVGMSDGKFK